MKKILLGSLFGFAFLLFTSLCEGQQMYFNFDSLSTGMTSPGARVLALTMRDSIHDDPLFAGGHFTIAGGDTAFNVAEWIVYSDDPYTGSWLALGKGVNNDVCALAMYKNNLYAGGKFDSAGGIASSHIARWDTAAHKWDSLLGKLNGNVYALCVYNNNLYVGGNFTIADGDTVNRIAVWKDSVWAPVGKGFDTGAVYALTISNDTLYAGGSFLKSNGKVVNHIAKLKGNNWDSLGSGTNNTVYALKDIPGLGGLFIGGAFTKSGGISTNYISNFEDYSSHTWRSLGSGMNDTVRALSSMYIPPPEIMGKHWVSNGYILIAGGVFDSVAGNSNSYIAAWGQYSIGWDSAGIILNGPVFALSNNTQHRNNNYLYLGGNFNTGTNDYPPTSAITINNIAEFSFYCLNCGGGIQNISDKSNIDIYPNPNNGKFTVVCHSEQSEESQKIEIYNVLGEKVLTETLRSAQGDNSIDLSAQPNGIYLYRVISETGNLVGQGKMIIQK